MGPAEGLLFQRDEEEERRKCSWQDGGRSCTLPGDSFSWPPLPLLPISGQIIPLNESLRQRGKGLGLEAD